jgi:hypothetical protein
VSARSRRGFLVAGARGVVAASALAPLVGAAGCGSGGPRALVPVPPVPFDDAAIARVLAGATLLGTGYYRRAAAVPGFRPAERRHLRALAADEREHRAAIAAAVPGSVPGGMRFRWPTGTFATPASALRMGVALERTTLGAFLGAVPALADPTLRALAAGIAANEAQHLQDLASLTDATPGPRPAIPAVLTPYEAATAVAGLVG